MLAVAEEASPREETDRKPTPCTTPPFPPKPPPLHPKAKRLTCPRTPTPTPTPTRSRGTDRRLRVRGLRRGQLVVEVGRRGVGRAHRWRLQGRRWAEARAAGSSRWGSDERARAGSRCVSEAAARVPVRTGVASVGTSWTEACPAAGPQRTWTAVLVVGWVVLAEEALVPRGASPEGPHAGSFYPATCTGGRSAPTLNPPGWGTEHPLPPLTALVFACFSHLRHGVVWMEGQAVVRGGAHGPVVLAEGVEAARSGR